MLKEVLKKIRKISFKLLSTMYLFIVFCGFNFYSCYASEVLDSATGDAIVILDETSSDYENEKYLERIEQENQYKLQNIEGSKHEEFLESWIKFVIRKEAANFEEIEAFLNKYKDTIPLKNEAISLAKDLLVSSKLNIAKKFIWLYKNDPSFARKANLLGLNEHNYQRMLAKLAIKDYTQLSKMLNYKSDFDNVSSMLSSARYKDVVKALKTLSPREQGIIKARLYLKTSEFKYRSAFVKSVDTSLYEEDDNLLYDYTKYLIKNGETEKALSKLLPYVSITTSTQDDWWQVKEFLIIELLKKKRYQDAFKLAKPNQYLSDLNLSRAKFLHGFIAYKFLKDYDVALDYFKDLYKEFSFALTKSRGAYWTARVYEATKDTEKARYWYAKAAEYPLTFYGQEAILQTSNLDDTRLFYKDEDNTNPQKVFAKQDVIFGRVFDIIKIENYQSISQSTNAKLQKTLESDILWRNAITLYGQDLKEYAMMFLDAFFKNNKDAKLSTLAIHNLKTLLKPKEYSQIIKTSSYLNINIIDEFYGHELPRLEYPNEALIYAIIHRESGFKTDAISNVGALGMMQIMPDTAKQITNELGIGYSYARLTKEPEYNILLGSYYINKLLKLFNYSYPLAIASYNGGARNVKIWLDRNNFKSGETQEIIDWIELIPFKETRNYVMRVLENEVIYRYIIKNK